MIPQGTPEWWQARKGIPTASRLDDLMAGGSGETRLKYAAECVAEAMGAELPSYSNLDMEWGITYERDAIIAYETATFRKAHDTGLLLVDFGDGFSFGATPDALIGEDGQLEVKCPRTITHILTFKRGIPSNYYKQVQGQLLATGRAWCDFVSYDPRLKGAEVYIQRIMPDLEMFDQIRFAVASFHKTMNDLKTHIKRQ